MTTLDVNVALGQFKKRKAANEGKTQINNSSLPAGSPMVYYCSICGDHTETLPESHFERPKTVCDPCKVLVDHGLVNRDGKIMQDPTPSTTRFEHKDPI